MENIKTLGANLGAIMKKWEEQTDQEKIETLRNVLQDNRYLVNRISQLETNISRLLKHSHVDGKVVMEVIDVRNEYNGSVMTRDKLA